MKLPKNICINKHIIVLIEGKQLLYSPIYTLSLVELETLKDYIKTHLKTRFIWLSKSLSNTTIFLTKNLIATYTSLLFIGVSIISLSRNNILYP